jgi:hypothetical protein
VTIAPERCPAYPIGDEPWITLASPTAGQPMISAIEAVARPVRDAVARVSLAYGEPQAYEQIFAPRVAGLGFTVEGPELATRAARAIIAEWLTGIAVGALTTGASLRDAEEWFNSGADLPSLVSVT